MRSQKQRNLLVYRCGETANLTPSSGGTLSPRRPGGNGQGGFAVCGSSLGQVQFQSWKLDTGQHSSKLQEGRITMDLTCPKCKSEDTQKLTMVTSATGLFGKILRFGVVYVYNLWIPLASVFFGIAFGIVFGLFNEYLGFLAFAALWF
jgi:hypothetical protein